MRLRCAAPLGILLAFASAASLTCFEDCAQGRFGCRCAGLCACAPHEDCADGVSGDGACSCQYGGWSACGVPSPLLPSDAGPAALMLDSASLISGLPEASDGSRRPRILHGALLSRTLPQPLPPPVSAFVVHRSALRAAFGGPLRTDDSARALRALSGAALLPGSAPFAWAYGGHQFGAWRGQLGDGRAVQLGRTRAGWELSLKGAGRTAFARAGDGRGTLASALREMLGGAALAALGVPAVQVLAVHTSAARAGHVLRDEWYDGRLRWMPAGLSARAAPTFLRFGALELAQRTVEPAQRDRLARTALAAVARVRRSGWVEHGFWDLGPFPPGPAAARHCFFLSSHVAPTIQTNRTLHRGRRSSSSSIRERLLLWHARRAAALGAAWTAVGFAHGALNTDNMSLGGWTLDLNVFGFVGSFADAAWSPSLVDSGGRYAFGRQLRALRWNVERLADALDVHAEPRGAALAAFDVTARACVRERFMHRLGLHALRNGSAARALADDWRRWLRSAEAAGVDFHDASRAVAELDWAAPGEWARRVRGGAAAETVAARLATALVGEGVSRARWMAHVRGAVPAMVLRQEALALLLAPLDRPDDSDIGDAQSDVAVDHSDVRRRVQLVLAAVQRPFQQLDALAADMDLDLAEAMRATRAHPSKLQPPPQASCGAQ